jgi:hypothetical protein
VQVGFAASFFRKPPKIVHNKNRQTISREFTRMNTNQNLNFIRVFSRDSGNVLAKKTYASRHRFASSKTVRLSKVLCWFHAIWLVVLRRADPARKSRWCRFESNKNKYRSNALSRCMCLGKSRRQQRPFSAVARKHYPQKEWLPEWMRTM